MATDLVKNVTGLLNEEKWTRATLNSYSIQNFKDLDVLIEQARSEGLTEQVREAANEHLKHTSNSIIALYLSGILALSRELVDDSNLVMLISIFMDNHKWNIVEFLSGRILEYGENKFALRTLAECYENRSEDALKLEIWDRLVRVDYEEADIARALGEKREEAGDAAGAVDYYKRAIHRYINKRQFNSIKELWDKLVELASDDIEFFFHVERRIAKNINGERAAALLATLLPSCRARGDWDTAIEILKRVLAYEPKNAAARKDIVDCYREKYANHSQLEDYLRISNLSQSWRGVHEAIADFEKHISFDTGNYVHHRTWGIGRIESIKDDTFTISFAGRPAHQMSLKMAVGALEVLAPDHIWVLKLTVPREQLAAHVKSDPAWALRTVIRSFGNAADMKRIKAELSPDVLTPGEWSRWNTEARSLLKKDPSFGNVADRVDVFTVRDKPISFEEKTYIKFKAEKNFFERARTLAELVAAGTAEPDSEWFVEMFSWFTAFVKGNPAGSETVVASWLLVQRIVAAYPFLNPGGLPTFEELFARIENVEGTFARIEDPELKREFLAAVRRHVAEWMDVFVRLFFLSPVRYIVDELAAAGAWDELTGLVSTLLARSKEYRDAFVWMVRNLSGESWLQERLAVSREKLLIGMINLLGLTFRDIANKRDGAANRRTNRQVQEYLFQEEHLLEFLMAADADAITRLYSLLDDVKDLDPSIRIHLKHKIKERFPDFRFLGEPEAEKVSLGLLVTRASFEAKQRELKHLIDVEIPENSREIGEAMSKGDLRENAEYKAALEKQEMLKAAASRMQEEVQQAQIFNEHEIRTDRIGFGTRVRLQNLGTGQSEEYVVLGPWESDPGRQVISYLSPLGAALWNHAPGEEFVFTIDENKFRYAVETIDRADLKGGVQ
jgi:transcription elongation factor GreA